MNLLSKDNFAPRSFLIAEKNHYFFQLAVGVIGQKETVFDKPLSPSEIRSVIYSTIQPYDIIQAVLQQEIVLYCGRLIATSPDMFNGILKIRVGYVVFSVSSCISDLNTVALNLYNEKTSVRVCVASICDDY